MLPGVDQSLKYCQTFTVKGLSSIIPFFWQWDGGWRWWLFTQVVPARLVKLNFFSYNSAVVFSLFTLSKRPSSERCIITLVSFSLDKVSGDWYAGHQSCYVSPYAVNYVQLLKIIYCETLSARIFRRWSRDHSPVTSTAVIFSSVWSIAV